MRIVFIGSTAFGLKCLEAIYDMCGMNVVGVVTNEQQFSISYNSNGVKNVQHACFEDYSQANSIDCYTMREKMTEHHLLKKMQDWDPDFIVVAGWYHMVPKIIRDIAPCGGLHASLLPHYSGGAPLVWAIINGEKKTGVSFFLLDEGVDSGLIIGQKEESIAFEDTIDTLYKKIETRGIELLKEYLPQIADGSIKYLEQNESNRTVMPQRCPEDGEIDINMNAVDMYNFIRAQSSPYPGAFIKTSDGKKLIIEKARIEE